MKQNERADVNACFKHFPYVNGGLFREHYQVPRFTKASRKKLIEGGTLDWATINPDIFGSMFQTVIDPEQRRHLGQHYTSVPNIMKVLNPLFLDDLHAELDKIGELPKSKNRDKKLEQFREKLSRIKVLDPACGSGNFCIVAYKELCHLEMEAISMYYEQELPFLNIRLDHFYGIEIDDFPCEIARLSLWLAQHQINMECYQKFGNANPTLPLTASGHIVCGNALRLDWNEICPVGANDIVYCCGNPPYQGGWLLSDSQRMDKENVFTDINDNIGRYDYVLCWFYLGAKYISNHFNVHLSFVATSSVNQGAQVSFWKNIFDKNIEIKFAYIPFKWENNASSNAGVTVTIIGLGRIDNDVKYLYDVNTRQNVNYIGPYLIPDVHNIVSSHSVSMFNSPEIIRGSIFVDGGHLIFTASEKDKFIERNPKSLPLFKKCIGAEEFINGSERWCLWIDENNLDLAKSIPEVVECFEKVKASRLASRKKETRLLASVPWSVGFNSFKPDSNAIIIPSISSERRKYIPIGYLEKDTVITGRAFVIYDAPLWLYSILLSSMHMSWMRTVCGKLESRYSYSNTMCYNTLPIPSLTSLQKERLEESAMAIIEAREAHYDMTNAELYNPETMPDDLKAAHDSNDLLVDSLYKRTGFKNDEERLTELFKRYEQKIKEAK